MLIGSVAPLLLCSMPVLAASRQPLAPPPPEQPPAPESPMAQVEVRHPGPLAPAFTLSVGAGFSTPFRSPGGGAPATMPSFHVEAMVRPQRFVELGLYAGGATGRYALDDNVANTEGVNAQGDYNYAMGGLRIRVHLFRLRGIDPWLAADIGGWRESGTFTGQPDIRRGFQFAAISPAAGMGAGVDFTLLRAVTLGGSARFLVATPSSGSRSACDLNCGDGFPGGGEGSRGFVEIGARLSWAFPIGDQQQ